MNICLQLARTQAQELRQSALKIKQAAYRNNNQHLANTVNRLRQTLIDKLEASDRVKAIGLKNAENMLRRGKLHAKLASTRDEDQIEGNIKDVLQNAQEHYMRDIQSSMKKQALSLKHFDLSKEDADQPAI